jgi:hypothetical protein
MQHECSFHAVSGRKHSFGYRRCLVSRLDACSGGRRRRRACVRLTPGRIHAGVKPLKAATRARFAFFFLPRGCSSLNDLLIVTFGIETHEMLLLNTNRRDDRFRCYGERKNLGDVDRR